MNLHENTAFPLFSKPDNFTKYDMHMHYGFIVILLWLCKQCLTDYDSEYVSIVGYMKQANYRYAIQTPFTYQLFKT